MSTTGDISQVTSTPVEDASLRILCGGLIPIQLFTDIGFDALACKVSLENGWTLENLTTNFHMAHLGRPLFGSLYDAGVKAVREDIVTFATAKLLNAEPGNCKVEKLTDEQKLACLSQRVPLEFNSTTHIAWEKERQQVEGHLRVCLKVDAAFESMVTVAPSEPLLSEAAYSIMTQASFNVPKVMKSVLNEFSINKGDHSELLAMLLFTAAHDKAVGPPAEHGLPAGSRIIKVASFLVGHLFQSNASTNLEKIHEDFPDSNMHFNHYIKVHEYEVVNAVYLLLLSSQGAGILCTNNQYAIDGINPFLCNGTKLELKNLGLILWQANNDTSFGTEPRDPLFKAMDVRKLNILQKDDAPVPIIKIVFVLASRQPFLTVYRHEPSKKYNTVVYNIWCAGISPNILNAVEPSQESVWNALLQATYGWKAIYEGSDVEKIRRSMNPGAATDRDHWRQ